MMKMWYITDAITQLVADTIVMVNHGFGARSLAGVVFVVMARIDFCLQKSKLEIFVAL